MNDILINQNTRKLFYFLIFSLITILLLLRFFLIPFMDPTLGVKFWEITGVILIALLNSLIVTVCIGAFIFYASPKKVYESGFNRIESFEINGIIRNQLSTTINWQYRGACGSFMRNKTIKALSEKAKKHNKPGKIVSILINPFNAKLCEQYGLYRCSVNSSVNNKSWDKFRASAESSLTILRLLLARRECPQLEIELFLQNSFSVFRYDVTDEIAVVTKEGPDSTGMITMKTSEDYYYVLQELKNIKSLSYEIPKTYLPKVNLDDLESCINILNEISGFMDSVNKVIISKEDLISAIKVGRSQYE